MALAPVPFRNALITTRDAMVTAPWVQWLQSLVDAIGLAAARAATYKPGVLGAALASTPIASNVSGGLYRVSFYLRITRAATTSSSATVVISATDGGIVCSQTFAALTGNTTASVLSAVRIFRADAGTAITATVAYASVGGTSMQYDLDIRVEALP